VSDTKVRIKEVLNQIKDLELVENEFVLVEQNKESLKVSIKKLLVSLEKKHNEIEELLHFGFKRIVSSIFNDKKKLIEKKRNDYYQLSKKYEILKTEQATVDFEYKILYKKINGLTKFKKELEYLIEIRESELIMERSSQGNSLKKIVSDIKSEKSILDRTENSIKIINSLFSKLTLLSASLQEVESYTSWKGARYRGRYSSRQKQKAIQDAKEYNIESKLLLNNLDKSLREINYTFRTIDLKLINFESLLGMFFDNIFSDIILQNKISIAVDEVERVYQKLKKIKLDLIQIRSDTNLKIKRFNEVKNSIILE